MSAYSVNNYMGIRKVESYFRRNFFVHLTFYAIGSPTKLLSNLIRPGLSNFFIFRQVLLNRAPKAIVEGTRNDVYDSIQKHWPPAGCVIPYTISARSTPFVYRKQYIVLKRGLLIVIQGAS